MAPQSTNTVLIEFEGDADAAIAEWDLREFGEIMAACTLRGEHGKVAVAFFDIRSAELAAKAHGFEMGPQIGARFAVLPGDAPFDEEDIWAISASQEEDGIYMLEFFDSRVAADYAAAAGARTTTLVSPPGLEDVACEVKVSGLPRNLLTDLAMETILEQAGFDEDVIRFNMKVGKTVGHVVIGFAYAEAAERCVEHFSGCLWGQHISAEIVAAPGTRLSAAAPVFQPWKQDAYGDGDTPCSLLSADAAEWMPKSNLTAEAPEFVPMPKAATSETSTDLSESEDERPSLCAASA
eukprot:CAMPEP_0176133928 /NCGR_PEP_ID=MMETSP0120_2-20121206/67908_1 /TAXON_ID=160619 /ORGANISM="Kryptoperidinium foliaceum, Strain CCMP 1326" /LENGTH=293 /DNA_ID=CAMNT_0017469549 /DNA_START=51 /DNA_END=932 /DNA_ORIENTATION=-